MPATHLELPVIKPVAYIYALDDSVASQHQARHVDVVHRNASRRVGGQHTVQEQPIRIEHLTVVPDCTTRVAGTQPRSQRVKLALTDDAPWRYPTIGGNAPVSV